MISLLYNHQDVRPTKKTYQNKQLHLQLNGKKKGIGAVHLLRFDDETNI